ncbi:MAG: hypothetical protein EOO09_19185, partial [Chitinophagaceae bacterium]
MIFRTLSKLLLIFLSLQAGAQRYIGQSEIINFEKRNYNGGAQNWAIQQDLEGRMYFANNEGLLVFDGTYWKLYPLPNKTIMRGLCFGSDKRLYVGGQDEFGYFSPDKSGTLRFTSLVDLIPEADRRFADIWNIEARGEEIFIRSSGRIFRYYNNKISSFPAATAWMYMGVVKGRVLAHDDQGGLTEFRDGSFVPLVPSSGLPAGFRINAITDFGPDSSLVCTNRFGVFLLAGSTLTPFPLKGLPVPATEEFSDALQVDPGHFVLSSLSNGYYFIDNQGMVLDNFAKRDGLQNSSVRSLFLDRDRNIWLGLDSGIDFIPFNNAIKHISPANMNDGAGFAVSVSNGHIYFGLSTGIYRMPLLGVTDLSQARNELTMLVGGQTYGFSVVNNQLLAARDDGFYQLDESGAHPVTKGTGFWTFESLQQFKQGPTVAAGTYLGVRLFENHNGVFTDKGSVTNFRTSSRFLVIDNDQTIWVSHPYRGIYRIGPTPEGLNYPVHLYTQSNGLPSTLNNHVYKIKNKVVIATEKGIYEYNQRADSFQVSEYYRDIFGKRAVRYLREDGSGNIWFIEDKNIGVVDFSTRDPKLIFLPELTGKIMSGFEHIYPVNDNNIFVGGEKGFYHINYAKYKTQGTGLDVYIRAVTAVGAGETLIYGGYSGNVNGSSAQAPDDVRS